MKVLSGNSAVAEAVKQVRPDVAVNYPVTPTTPISEEIASFIANGQMDAELMNTESDHSSISACIGASAAGGRTFTASSSQGLAMMHEILFIAASFRLPIVMAVGNRALAAPTNIHTDHGDSMAQRDCGWIQLYSANAQEAYDNTIQAFKIAEHADVKNPIMVCMDGFITTHTMTNVQVENNSRITEFVGKYVPHYSLLDIENPTTIGTITDNDIYFEHKVNQLQGMEQARTVIKDVGKEFGHLFGRYYGSYESYKLDDAQHAIVLIGSAAGTVKEQVDQLRAKGEKVGLLKLRVFRPFPHREIREALAHLKSIAVLDRSLNPGGYGGPLFNEIRSALYDLENRPAIFPYIYGLGGKDLSVGHLEEVFSHIQRKETEMEKMENQYEPMFINLRDNA